METNLKSIELIVPETNEYLAQPSIIPEEFRSISEPLHYSLVPDFK